MQKNVAGQNIGAQLVSATDGSAFTGSVTISVTGDAGTQATGTVGSGACTHEGNGYHTYAPAQAETNYDLVAFTFTGTGAVPVTVQIYTRVDANTIQIEGADPTDTIRDAVVDDATRIDASALNTASVTTIPAILDDTDLIDDATSGLAKIATDVAAVLVDTGTTLQAELDGIQADTEDIQTKIGTPAGVSVSADIAAVKVDTAATLVDTAEIGAAGAGLTAIPWNASWDAEVESEVNDGLTAFWTSPATLVDLVWDEVLTGATHNVASSAGRRLRGLQDFTAYSGGAVWIDTLAGTAGTTSYENGTPDNPVDTLADATTIATAVNLKHFHLANGSNITLAASYDNYEFEGDEYTIALGGQSIANTSVKDALLVSGTYIGYPHILRSIIGGITGPGAKIGMCAIRGAVVLDANTNITVLHDCWTSNSAQAAFDFGSGVGANTVYIQNYNGNIEVRNMVSGDTLWFSGTGQLTLAASCTGGTVNISGNVELINSGSGLTINDAGRVAEDQSIAAVTTVTNLTNAPTNGDLTATMKVSVNAEVLDVLNTDTFAEPGQGTPSATLSLVEKIGYLFKAWRNKSEQTATTYSLYADDATTVDQKATVSDDATTLTKGEIATGP